MAEEAVVLNEEREAIREEMQESRAGLADKMEALEQGVKDAWQGVTEAVEDVKETVATTVQAMQGAVHDTGKAIGWAFDVPAHVRRHPWLLVGGALFLGVVVGSLVGRARR
jgi:hypothetical protein